MLRAGGTRVVRFGAVEWAAAGLPAAQRSAVAAAAEHLAHGGAVSALVEQGAPGDREPLVRCAALASLRERARYIQQVRSWGRPAAVLGRWAISGATRVLR